MYDIEKVEPSLKPYILAYEKFKRAVPHKVVHSEKVVFSKEYAGRFDAVIEDSVGQRWLVDWKTSNSGLYDETGLQLSAYLHADFFEPETMAKGVSWANKDVYGLMGVLLSKDGTFQVREYPDSFETFLACLQIYKWKNGKT